MKKRNKIKRVFTLEIEVEEDTLIQCYPNYKLNFKNPIEFIEYIKNSLVISENVMNEFGYSVNIKPSNK